jgi:hypothetical protein
MRPIVAVRPDVAVLLEPYLEELSADIVQEVVRRIPEYAGESETEHLIRIVSLALQQFANVMTDPEAPWDKIITLWQEIGEFEWAAGRTLELLESTQRSVAQLAWRRIVDKSETHGLSNETLSLLLESILAFVGVITDAARDGHVRAGMSGDGEPAQHRRRLIRELLAPEPAAEEHVGLLARGARWPVPATVAVVLLRPAGDTVPSTPELPADHLAEFDRRTPVLVVPDPDTPGRLDELAGRLTGWRAVVGPAVRPQEAGRSRRWAAEAMNLVRRGILPDDPVVRCVDHVPTLVIFHAEDLLDTAAAQRLSPFRTLSAPARTRLSETLLMLLRCHFNATKAASYLDIHPQTVRLRQQRLEEIFGADLQDREHRLEMQMLLYAGLAREPAPG